MRRKSQRRLLPTSSAAAGSTTLSTRQGCLPRALWFTSPEIISSVILGSWEQAVVHVEQYVVWNPLTGAYLRHRLCPGRQRPDHRHLRAPGDEALPPPARLRRTVGDHLMVPAICWILRVGDAVWRELPLLEDDCSAHLQPPKISMKINKASFVSLHGNLHWLVA